MRKKTGVKIFWGVVGVSALLLMGGCATKLVASEKSHVRVIEMNVDFSEHERLRTAEYIREKLTTLSYTKKPSWKTRAMAAYIIGYARYEEGVEPLIKLLDDEECSVSWHAHESLRKFNDPRARHAVSARTNPACIYPPNPNIGPNEFDPVVHAVPDEYERTYVAGLLQDKDQIFENLKSPHPRIRAIAAIRLGFLRYEEGIESLVTLLDGEQECVVRRQAVFSLIMYKNPQAKNAISTLEFPLCESRPGTGANSKKQG